MSVRTTVSITQACTVRAVSFGVFAKCATRRRKFTLGRVARARNRNFSLRYWRASGNYNDELYDVVVSSAKTIIGASVGVCACSVGGFIGARVLV